MFGNVLRQCGLPCLGQVGRGGVYGGNLVGGARDASESPTEHGTAPTAGDSPQMSVVAVEKTWSSGSESTWDF